MPGFIGFTVADELYNFLYRGIPIEIEDDLYMRLLVSPSNRSGGGVETNYGNYQRLAFTRDPDTSIFSASANGQIVNGVIVEFASPSTVGNGDLLAFDIVDTPAGAFTKIYNGGPILPADPVIVGKAPKYGAGRLMFTL